MHADKNYAISHMTESLAKIDEIFKSISSKDCKVAEINAQEFADAWQGCRNFKDQSLLLLARYAAESTKGSEEFRLSYEDVAIRIVAFTFKFLPLRQIAFTFDLLKTLIASTDFERQVLRAAEKSEYSNEALMAAVTSGISGMYFFHPEKLVNLQIQISSDTAFTSKPAPREPNEQSLKRGELAESNADIPDKHLSLLGKGLEITPLFPNFAKSQKTSFAGEVSDADWLGVSKVNNSERAARSLELLDQTPDTNNIATNMRESSFDSISARLLADENGD